MLSHLRTNICKRNMLQKAHKRDRQNNCKLNKLKAKKTNPHY